MWDVPGNEPVGRVALRTGSIVAGSKRPASSEEMIRAARDQFAVGEASERMVEAARREVQDRLERPSTAAASPTIEVSDAEAPPVEPATDNLVTVVREQPSRSDPGQRRTRSPSQPVPPTPGPIATSTRKRRRIFPALIGVLILFSLVSQLFNSESSDAPPEPPVVVTTVAVQPPPTTTPTVLEGTASGLLTVGTDTVLTADHHGTITIFQNGTTLDCAGHAVIGSGLEGTGIDIEGRTGVTVRNCEVQSFNIGISLQNSWDVEIADSSPAQNRTGIRLVNSDDNRIIDNVADRNIVGIVLAGSHNNVLERNVVERGQQGILIDDSDRNLLAGNRVLSMSDWFAFGFINGAEGNHARSNVAEDSGSGFAINVGANHNTFTGNHTEGNQVGFNVLDDPGTELNGFFDNTARNNEHEGFKDTTRGQLGDRATQNIYSGNLCEDNGVPSSPSGLCD